MPEYSGEAVLEVFESFIHKFDSWCRSKSVAGIYAVDSLSHALKGSAAEWYTRYVALHAEEWTVEEIYKELYEYCFPVKFRENLLKKLMRSKQQGKPLKDFAKDIENLAVRYPEVDPYTRKRIFWDGVDNYVRLFLIAKGRSVERDSYKVLVHYARRAELVKLEETRSSRPERQEPAEPRKMEPKAASASNSRTSNWRGRSRPGRRARDGDRAGPSNSHSQTKTSASARQVQVGRGQKRPERVSGQMDKPRLTPREIEEHRSQGF